MIFDDAHSHTSGYAATAGDVRASRIASTSGLASDVTWITNLGYNVSSSSGMTSHSRYRRDDFLKRKISSIASSIGLTEKALEDGHPLVERFVLERKIGDMVSVADYPSALSLVISQIFGNVAKLGETIFGYDFNHIHRYNLGLREIAHPKDKSVGATYIADALTNAYTWWVNCERDAKFGRAMTMSFRLEPVSHALNILNVPIPSGSWTSETNPEKALEIIAAGDKPYAARVSIKNVHPEFNRILNFGSRGTYKGGRGTSVNRRFSMREWLTDIELKMIDGLAEVHIKEIIYCNKAIDYDWIIESRNMLEFLKDKLMLSVSGGVLAENVWTGVAAQYRDKTANAKSVFNPVTPFMYALDRYYCFAAAVQLSKLGFNVNGYGAGQVVVEYDPDVVDWNYIAEVAVQLGLIPPAGIVQSLESADLTTPLGIMQSLTATGDIGRIVDIDNKVTTSISDKLIRS